MKDKNGLIALILLVVTITVLLTSYFVKNNKEEKKEKIDIVTNYSNFYTVDSCLNRFVIFLSSKDEESILSILNDEYIKKEEIKKENVLDLFSEVKEGSNFVSKKMYYTKISENISKYYVYGSIEYNELQTTNNFKSESNDVYFIVYIDKNKRLYSVEPYSGDIFNSGEEYE